MIMLALLLPVLYIFPCAKLYYQSFSYVQLLMFYLSLPNNKFVDCLTLLSAHLLSLIKPHLIKSFITSLNCFQL